VANTTYYVWALPTGATIATGAGTNAITVDFDANASSGNITVTPNNTCGNGGTSPAFAVTVTPLPGAAGTITGSASVCKGASGVVYSIAPVVNATSYNWTVPAGAAIEGGGGTNSITVDFGMNAVSGVITVSGTNSCGNGTVSPDFAVTVNPIPPTPTVTASGELLTSSAPAGNQWYFEGTMIAGATGQTYIATATGYYWVVVTLNGCSSDESNHEYVVITGMEKKETGNYSVYPVPNDGRFTISINTPVSQIFSISIYNNLGIKVYFENDVEVNSMLTKSIDLRPMPTGVYSIVFQSQDNKVVRKILINR
jgi:hypothetical protein